ncbi:MAG: hypothetical protein HYX29_04970 [Solirubrobacterales bacterium]|nr:hypothetical protein [Solirubrobacterales bacterium]
MSPTEKKLRIFEDIARLRRVERELPENRDLWKVRDRLEREIGRTVSQRFAARAIGVSHTAIQRWIASGDIPTVYTPKGRIEVPLATVVDLSESVESAKSSAERKGHFLEPALQANRDRARQIKELSLGKQPISSVHRDPHDAAAERALAFHEAVARDLQPETVRFALTTLWRLRDEGRIHSRYADEWEIVLARSLDQIRREMVEDSERGRDLRQNSPFAGALSEVERREAIAQVAG